MTDRPDWPFEAWLKIAVMQLGLSPSEFWNMSLIDWFALTQASAPLAMRKADPIKLEDDYEQFR
ncbi:phage tail assembly chaperone [Hellea sp.]|nr:phage tail assembly chaperone [Hellea sp.]